MTQLTVGLVAGPHRDRARRALTSLLGQSMAEGMKVHVIDTEPTSEPVVPAQLPHGLELQVTAATPDVLIGGARATVAREAVSPLVGFLEEHCVAHPDWAAALVAAHASPDVGAAAGVIVNLESEPFLARVAALCSYRASLPPVPKPEAEVLFGQNVCYKKIDLDRLDENLDFLLTTELVLFRHLRKEGRRLAVVEGAKLQHAGLSRYVDVLHGVYHYDRAAYGLCHRLGEHSGIADYARALLSPPVRTVKTFAVETRVRGLPRATLIGLPLVLAIHAAAACGQISGRLFGPGSSPQSYSRNELLTGRTDLPQLVT